MMEVVGKEVGEMRNRLDLEVFMMVMEIECMFEGKKMGFGNSHTVDYRGLS